MGVILLMIDLMTRGSLLELQRFDKTLPAETYMLMPASLSVPRRNALSQVSAKIYAWSVYS